MENTQVANRTGFLIPYIILLISMPEFAIDMYVPSLPALGHYFVADKSVIALTITAFLIGQAVSQLFYGAFADRFGRKPAIIIGSVISVLGSILCMLSTHLWMFMLGRILLGLGTAIGLSMTLAIVRDVYEGAKMAKMFSIVTTIYFVVFALAPIMGGYFQHYLGWRSVFIFLTAYTAFITLLTLFGLKETHHAGLEERKVTPVQILKNYGSIIIHKQFLFNMLAVSFGYCVLFAYAAITPFLFQHQMGFTAVQYGWLSVFIAAAFILGSLINARFVEKLGIHKMVTWSLVLMLVSAVVMLVLGLVGLMDFWAIMAPIGFVMLGLSILGICCPADAMSPFGDIAGSAGAMWGSAQFFITFASSFVFAHVGALTQVPLSWAILALAILSTLCIVILRLTAKKEPAV